MKDLFFNFSFEHWPAMLLSFIPAIVNLAIFLYLLLFIKRSYLSSSFLILLFFLFMWQMEETMLRVCATEECARIWNRMFTVCTGFVTSAGLHFVFFLTGNKRIARTFLIQFFLYVPNFFISLLFVSDLAYSEFVHTKNWGWMYEPQNNVAKIGLLWLLLQALVIVVYLLVYLFKLRGTGSILYKQIRILLVGISIPAIFANVFQGAVPILFHTEPIPLASALLLCFSITSLIAITQYDLFEYSPVHQWRSIVENMNEGILIVDNEDIIQYVNPKFCQMLGYSSTELINKSAHDMFWIPQEGKIIDKLMERGKNLFRDRYEMEMKRKDGSTITCRINAQPYLDHNNKVVGSVGIHTDITEQKEAIKKIKDSENRYRSLVEQATDGIAISDKKGNYLDVNSKAHQMLGYSKSEMLKLNIKDLIFEDDLMKNPPRIQEVLEGKTVSYARLFKRKDGSALSCEVSARMFSEGYILASFRDITERKRTEEELLEKVQEMDAFIYRASHDLRGPLASIAGLATLGKNEIKDTKATFYLNKIHDSVARLDDILQELSKIARVTQAKIEPEDIDLKNEVEDILQNLRTLPNYSRIEFKMQITTSIISDRSLIAIILQNIIINSIQYMDEGKANPIVQISVHKNEAGTEIVVSDNGIGIPADVQDKVFEMFYRGTSISKGSGLGLYVVKNAVKKLKGSIKLSGNEGEGAVFTVSFPPM